MKKVKITMDNKNNSILIKKGRERIVLSGDYYESIKQILTPCLKK